MINIKSIFSGVVVGSCIVVMVLSFMFTLADVASKPAVRPAVYAVSSHISPPVQTDQGCATSVSLGGPSPDLLSIVEF